MPKFFVAGILFFLLLATASSQQTAQARTVPWDCADWQAFAHEDRDTAILESLAENRGKTLYCGIDQSDTFAKAETWAAGRDHNERDDTVYWGERGSFRGFIAAQEGWLTDGESGITGQSIAVIFEFPKTGKTVRRTKRITVGSGPVSSKTDNTCMTDLQDGREPGTLICSGWSAASSGWSSQRAGVINRARKRAVGMHQHGTWRTNTWDTNLRYRRSSSTHQTDYTTSLANSSPTFDQWTAMAEAAARSACRSRGARYAAGSAEFGAGHNDDAGSGGSDAHWVGDGLGFFYDESSSVIGGGTVYNARARQSRTWSATCIKKGPRR